MKSVLSVVVSLSSMSLAQVSLAATQPPAFSGRLGEGKVVLSEVRKAGDSVHSVNGTPIEEGSVAEAYSSEQVIGYLRMVRRIALAYRGQWLNHSAKEIIFWVAPEERTAFEALRAPLRLSAVDRNGFVLIPLHLGDHSKVDGVQGCRSVFLSQIGYLRGLGKLSAEALELARWASETAFYYRPNRDAAETVLRLLTPTEYRELALR